MIFYDASTDPELAVEAAVLTEVVRAAAAVGVEVLVIGEVARDILIRHLLGARPERATKDVDVAVADWAAYDDLTSSLQRSSGPSHGSSSTGSTSTSFRSAGSSHRAE